MEDILFIINPIAGGGKAKGLIPLIEDTMNKHSKKFEIILTEKSQQATQIAEDNILNYDVIVAVGGDGTVNEVARGLLNKNKGILGIIPGGTGNDMAKSLGISTNPSEALQTIINGHRTTMNIGKVNEHNFLNISSVGFDAEVVMHNNKLKKVLKSSISYAISVVYTLIDFKKKKVEIQIDDEKIEENIILLAVGNGKYYGGGMKILPMAKIDDGYLDICIISNLSKFMLLFLFPTIFKGNHIKYKKYVKTYRGRKIKIKGKEDIPLNIDGELMKAQEVLFSLEDKKLGVICEKE